MFNFKKANYTGMNEYLTSLNFDEILADKTLEQKVDIFHGILSSAVQQFVPIYEKKAVQKCPWANNILRSMKNKKNKSF